MPGTQRGFPLVGKLHQAWKYWAPRSHSYFISARAFAVVQMNLTCSGPSKSGMRMYIWVENKEHLGDRLWQFWA